jgi:hypothetical protein
LLQLANNYPDPSEKNKDGELVYKTHEAFLIQYYKQYGVTNAIKQIHQFIEVQNAIANDLINKQKDEEYTDNADNLYGQI